jgi:MFS family permease
MTSGTGVAVEAAEATSRRAWQQLAAGTGASALLQADGPLITVALPRVGQHFAVPAGQLAAALVGYFAAYALALPLGGRLTDRVGPRQAAAAGLVLFALGCLAGALAPTFGLLVAARVVQGLGAGCASPAALVGAISSFPPHRRGMALGIWGASTGVANVVSPLLGGELTQTLGWRVTWWSLAALASVLAMAALRTLPTRPPNSAPATVAILRNGAVLAAVGLATITFGVLVGFFFLAEQYLQQAAGYSPLRAAAAMAVVAVLLGAAAPVAGRLADRNAERPPLQLGIGLLAAGLMLGGSGLTPLHGVGALPILALIGAGLGFLLPPTTRAALRAVPASHSGRVSAALSAGRVVGAALGSGLAGLALIGGVSGPHVRLALFVAVAAVAAMLPLTVLATPAAATFARPG